MELDIKGVSPGLGGGIWGSPKGDRRRAPQVGAGSMGVSPGWAKGCCV